MEDTKKKRKPNRRKSNFFLTCFGFSFEPVLEGENPSKMVINITPTKEKIINSNKKRNLIRWFSSSTSSGLKTVPVDPTDSSEKVPGDRKKSPAASKSKKRTGDDNNSSSRTGGDSGHKRSRNRKSFSSSKDDDPEANQKPPRRTPEITSVQTPEEEILSDQVQTSHGSVDSIILGNGKQPGHVEAGNNDKWQKRQSFARKIDALRTPKSQLGSPEIKPKPNRAVPNRSTSFLISSHDKLTDKPVIKLKTVLEDPSKEADSKNYDSIIGMSIILVILLIYLLWGRVCAVLCTCAWLYFVPLLRTMIGQDGTTTKPGLVQNEPDFDSVEYKKRVVLEGFLERRHRSGA